MPGWLRHALMALLVISSAALWAQNAPQQQDPLAAFEQKFEIQTVRLWDGPAPGAKGTDAADIPSLTVFLPQKDTGNGTAVIICPGGAHLWLANNLEGRQVADWFSARGVTAFVLTYRLGPKYVFPVPLWDALRAVRLVRARAREFGVSPDRVGLMGFSAGGHLAALTATLFGQPNPNAADDIDRASARPGFLILAYPWLNAMQPQIQNFITYCSMLKIPAGPCSSLTRPFTPVLHVTSQTPPTFIFHTDNDSTVPVSASVDFYRALHEAGVPAEMHIFATGRHGMGLGLGDPALDLWPTLLEAWMRQMGLFTSPAKH